MTAPGLRERKKARTREAIVEAAFDLFADKGFQATTVADIAAAADIAPRTFFGYFASKEGVVFYDFGDVLDGLSAALAARPPGATAVDGLRSWIETGLRERRLATRHDVLRRRLIESDDALAAHNDHQMARFEDLMAEQVAVDLGDTPSGLRPRLVAAAAVAAMKSLGKPETDEPPDPTEAMAVIDEAFTFLNGGIAALRDAPRSSASR
jgi:AcrR family transcriptional regulator